VERIEVLRVRRGRRAARHHQNGVVLVRHALELAGDRPGELLGVAAVREGHGPEAVAGHVPLHPHLRGRELVPHRGLRVARQLRVPEGVVADLVALAGQVLELATRELGLVEQGIGRLGPGQDVERGRVAEAGVLPGEGLEDADAALGVDDPVVALLDIAELSRRGVVEREDDRARAGGQRDPAVDVVGEGHRAVAPLPQALQILPEVLGGAGPAVLGLVDLVVLEDHHAAQLVGRQRGGLRSRAGAGPEAHHEQGGREDGPHGYGVALVRAAVLGRSAAAV
jgi:hypothetical protein